METHSTYERQSYFFRCFDYLPRIPLNNTLVNQFRLNILLRINNANHSTYPIAISISCIDVVVCMSSEEMRVERQNVKRDSAQLYMQNQAVVEPACGV